MRCRLNGVATLVQEYFRDNRSKHTDRRETMYLKHDRGRPASQGHDKIDERDTEIKKIRKGD